MRILPLVLSALGLAACASSTSTTESPSASKTEAPPSSNSNSKAEAAAEAEAEGAVSSVQTLSFGWRAGDRALVDYTAKSAGRGATLRYILFVDPDGDSLVMSPRNFEFVGVDDDEALRKLTAELPPYRVAKNGAWIGFDDIDDILKKMESAIPAADLEAYRSVMATPGLRSMVLAKLEETWSMWVQAWVDVEIRKQDVSFEDETQIGDQKVKMPSTLQVQPLDGGKVKLRLKTLLKGAQASRALVDMMMKVAMQSSPSEAKRAQIRKAFSSMIMERRTTIEAVLDAKSMRPDKVTTDSEVIVISKGRKQTRLDSKEWSFRWKTAD